MLVSTSVAFGVSASAGTPRTAPEAVTAQAAATNSRRLRLGSVSTGV